MDLKETTVKKHTLYEGKILNLRRDEAALPDGRPCVREFVEHSGGAAVLCIREGKVALVRQYRYAYGEELLEIPAGKLEAGEDPESAAARELAEETGLIAEKLTHLCTMYPSPGYTNEKIYVYEATAAQKGAQRLDEDEFLGVEYLPLEEAYRMMDCGKIRDAKTMIALLHYKGKNAL